MEKPCPPGKERNAVTKRCRKIADKACPPGKERNPVTKRCRNIVKTKNKSVKKTKFIHPNFIEAPAKLAPLLKKIRNEIEDADITTTSYWANQQNNIADYLIQFSPPLFRTLKSIVEHFDLDELRAMNITYRKTQPFLVIARFIAWGKENNMDVKPKTLADGLADKNVLCHFIAFAIFAEARLNMDEYYRNITQCFSIVFPARYYVSGNNLRQNSMKRNRI
jgi:hypothetical protein